MKRRSVTFAVCQNPLCDYYNKVLGKDIIKRGKNRAGHQQYLCLHCMKVFPETAGTILFNSHLRLSKILSIIDMISKGFSIRAISKTTGHHRDIISDKLEIIAMRPDETNKYLEFNLSKTPPEIKRFWETLISIKTSFSKAAYDNVVRMKEEFMSESGKQIVKLL